MSVHADRPGKAGPTLFALALGGFCIGTTEFAAMGLLPNIAGDLGATIPAGGHSISAYALGVVVGAPLLIVAAARVNRRTLLLFLMGLFALGNALSALAPNLGLLIAARFVAGLPHGAFFGVGAVMGTAVVGPARRGMAVSMMMAGLTVANIIGVPLSAVLGAALGWRSAFAAVAGLGLLTLAAVAAWAPSLPMGPQASVRGELGTLRNSRLWLTAAAGAVGFGGMFAVYSYVSPLLTEAAGLGVSRVPWVLALFGAGMTAGTLLGGRLSDRSVLRTAFIGFVSTAAVLLALGLLGRNWVFAAACIGLLGVSSQILSLAFQSRLMDENPSAPSLGAALCHGALNVGNASGAWLGGLAIAAGWGFLSPAWAGLAVTLAGFVFFIALTLVPRR